MPVTVVVGGQFGSEGKGKVAYYFAREKRATIAVRVGGSNSGHTVIDDLGGTRVFRMLPTAAILPGTICVLAAGSYIDADVLRDEIAATGLTPDRLLIDPNAYVITEDHKRQEREWSLGERIGSTQSGTGAAVVERIRRLSAQHLAWNDDRLAPFVSKQPVRTFLRARLKRGENVILEGTQGFGLSLLQSPYYPKATSRDTTAAAFVAEAGLSPFDVDDIVLVIRAFPIRVAGDSGPLPEEIDWETVSREGGWQTPLIEHTSVTKKVRRVARFDPDVVRAAVEANLPTKIVLNHLDYLDVATSEKSSISVRQINAVLAIEDQIIRQIDLLGLGAKILIRRPETTLLRQIA